jgi:ADP-heptose:LPS heptosyltransferase
VGDALAEQGLSVLVTGMGAEREVVEAVMNHMCHPTQNLCDRLSLGGLAALLARAALLVCNDTGPLHLANAVGTPNVGVFWGKNFCNWTHFNRSKHRPLPSWVTHCPICGADLMVMTPLENLCDHRTCLVQSVTPDEVIVQALDLLTYHEAAYA